MPIYRTAIIGCGDMGGRFDERSKGSGIFSHAGALRQVERFKLVAAADNNIRRLREFGRFWQVDHTYEDYRELVVREKPDVVCVCTPDGTHQQIILDVLDANAPKLIFVEKPLAVSHCGEEKVLARAEEKGTRIVVDYQRRWEPEHQTVARQLREGAIGSIQALSVVYVKGLRHVGCTVINTLRFLVSEIAEVAALPPHVVGTFADSDPSLDALLFFGLDRKACVQSCDKQGYTYSIFEIDIFGSKGRVQILDNGDRVIRYRLASYRHYSGFRELKRCSQVATKMPQALVNGVREIAEILDRDRLDYTNSGREAHKDSLVLEAISLSRERGGDVVGVTGIG